MGLEPSSRWLASGDPHSWYRKGACIRIDLEQQKVTVVLRRTRQKKTLHASAVKRFLRKSCTFAERLTVRFEAYK